MIHAANAYDSRPSKAIQSPRIAKSHSGESVAACGFSIVVDCSAIPIDETLRLWSNQRLSGRFPRISSVLRAHKKPRPHGGGRGIRWIKWVASEPYWFSCSSMVSSAARVPKAPHRPYGLSDPGLRGPVKPCRTPPARGFPASTESVMKTTAPSAINT